MHETTKCVSWAMQSARRASRRAHIVVALVFLASATVAPQESGGHVRVVKPAGWSIPVDTTFVADGVAIRVGGLDVARSTVALPNPPPAVVVESISVPNPTEVRIATFLAEPRSAYRYSLHGDPYAYDVTFVYLGSVDNDGSRVYLGAATTFQYVDEDGDGRFECRYQGPREPVVPGWLKTKNAPSTGGDR